MTELILLSLGLTKGKPFFDARPGLCDVVATVCLTACVAALFSIGACYLPPICTWDDSSIGGGFPHDMTSLHHHQTVVENPLLYYSWLILLLLGLTEGKPFFDVRPGLCDVVATVCLTACVAALFSIGGVSFNRYVHICHHGQYHR